MHHDLQHLVGRAARLGLVINVLVPAVIAVIAFALRESGAIPTIASLGEEPSVLFYVLGAVGLGELVVGFFLRRALFATGRVRAIRHYPAMVEQWVVKSSTIVFAVGASPVIYGAVLYLLGGDLGQFAFFGILTLLAYRFFRPTTDFLEEILEAAEAP